MLDKFRIRTYNVGFVTKGPDAVMAEGICPGDIRWLRHGYKDRFFADPFLLRYDEDYYYILCEEYLFFEEKGKITCLTVRRSDLTLTERRVVIEEAWHLSFPFCEVGGETVTPESVAAGKTYRYRIDPQSLTVLSREEILDEGLVDAAFLTDAAGTEWAFAGKREAPSADLYTYARRRGETRFSPIEGPLVGHKRHARSAGRLFDWQGRLLRPVQDCEARYGHRTVLMEVLRWGDDGGYEAKEHLELCGLENPPYNETMHTFNVYEPCVLVDGSRDFLRFPAKILYKKCRGLFQKRLNK